MGKCGAICEIFQRTVGYFAVRSNVNPGKLEEIKMRKMYKLPALDPENFTIEEEDDETVAPDKEGGETLTLVDMMTEVSTSYHFEDCLDVVEDTETKGEEE